MKIIESFSTFKFTIMLMLDIYKKIENHLNII